MQQRITCRTCGLPLKRTEQGFTHSRPRSHTPDPVQMTSLEVNILPDFYEAYKFEDRDIFSELNRQFHVEYFTCSHLTQNRKGRKEVRKQLAKANLPVSVTVVATPRDFDFYLTNNAISTQGGNDGTRS